MASVTTPTINKIIRLNNYDLLGTKCKKYNMYMCLDTLQLWYDESDSKRVLYGYVGVDTVNDLQNNIIPELGTTYYCWESNSLWLWMNRWICIYTDGKYPSAYRTDNGTIDAVYLDDQQPTIVDNNGLLRDGSVVVRDANRIIKGRLYVSDDKDNLVISSYLGGGVRILPNGAFSTDGELYIDDQAKAHLRSEWNVLNNEIYVDYTEKPDKDTNEFRDSTHRYKVWHEGNLKLSSFDLTGENIYNKLIDAQKDGTLPNPLVLNVNQLNGLKSTDFALKSHIHSTSDISDFKTAVQNNVNLTLDSLFKNMIYKGARISWVESSQKYMLSTDTFVLSLTDGVTGQGTVNNNSNTTIKVTVDPTKHIHTDLVARIETLEEGSSTELENYYNKQETEELLAGMFSTTPEEGKALLVDNNKNLPGNALTASDLNHDTALNLIGDIEGNVTFGYDKTSLNLTTDASNIISDTPTAGKALKLDADGNLPTKAYSAKELDHEIDIKLIGDVTGTASLNTATNQFQIDTKIGETAENAVPWSAVGRDVASLENGKVPLVQLPDGIMSSVKLVGTWSGSTAPSNNPEEGQAWLVTADSTFNEITYETGDWIYYYESSWNRADLSSAVKSVNNKSGSNITLNAADVGAIDKSYQDYSVGAQIPANKVVITDSNGHIAGATVDHLTNEYELQTDTAGDVIINTTASVNTTTNGTENLNVRLELTDTGIKKVASVNQRDILVNSVSQAFKKKLNFEGAVTATPSGDILTLTFDNSSYELMYYNGTADETFMSEFATKFDTRAEAPFYIAFENNDAIHFVGITGEVPDPASSGELIIQSDENTIRKENNKLSIKTSTAKITVDRDAIPQTFEIVPSTEEYETATKLVTARNINGTAFDGTKAITTANWGTTRAIGIVNSDGTGTAVTTNVNGSAAVNLKLPSSIKAALDGNAKTATTLQTARKINGVEFNGSKDITIADSTKLPLTGGTLSGDLNFSKSAAMLTWNEGGIHQRIKTTDDDVADTAVFTFQQSKDTGATFNDLMTIKDDGEVIATQFTGALSGNASSSTYATNARITNTNPTSGTWYYPSWVAGTTANTNYPLRVNDGFRYYSLQGTASANGRSILQLGNGTNAGTAGNKFGEIRLYGTNTGYATIKMTAGTTGDRVIWFPDAAGTVALTSSTVSKASTLATARTINGTSFNGSANITTANWGTARTITIGSTGKSVNGSGNVSWTLAEIGAAASSHSHSGYASSSHTHSYLPLSGGTMTGTLTNNSLSSSVPGFKSNTGSSWINGIKGQSAIYLNSTSADSLKSIASIPSTNGRFVLGSVGTNFYAGFMNNTNINNGTNALTYSNIICSESGGMTCSGRMTAGSLTVQGHKVFIQASTPSGAATNDIWIDI